jgi:hypothetical protein
MIAAVLIVATVMSLAAGILNICLTHQRRKNMFTLYHQERMAALEKGIDLPPLAEDFFHENRIRSRGSPHRTLLGGLILMFFGLTLYLALHFAGARSDDDRDRALFALIPAGIGVACLIYYFTVGRKLAAAAEADRKARLAEPPRIGNPLA